MLILSLYNAKPPELTIINLAPDQARQSKVEALRKRTEQAEQNLEAAKAHLRAAEAEHQQLKAKKALILRQKAHRLASIADGEQLLLSLLKKVRASKSAETRWWARGAQPVTIEATPATAAGGRIDPFEDRCSCSRLQCSASTRYARRLTASSLNQSKDTNS